MTAVAEDTHAAAPPAVPSFSIVPLKGLPFVALAVGGVIAAGLDGLERGLEPPEPVAVDPATLPDDEREARGIVRLPATQEEALDALAADEVLLDALGPVLAGSYLAVRRSEWAAYSAGDAAFEQQGHFEKY
jgi:glutamine synthetase